MMKHSIRALCLVLLAACDSGNYELACESHGAQFPLLEKACASTSDCFIALHTTSCCGSQIAIRAGSCTTYVP